MANSPGSTIDVRRRQAGARALMAAIWMVGGAVLAVLLLLGSDVATPAGRAGALLGYLLGVGAVIAFALVAVNGSLRRRPDRVDARGAADLLTLATTLVGVAAVVLVLVLGTPLEAAVVVLAFLGLLLFGLLVGVGLWTRSAARRSAGA